MFKLNQLLSSIYYYKKLFFYTHIADRYRNFIIACD